MTVALIALFSLASGFVKGTTGFGSSLVAIPLLSFYFPIEQIVIMIITYNVILNSLLVYEEKDVSLTNIKHVWVITLFGVIATFIGLYFLSELDGEIIKYIAAGLIIIAVLNSMFHFHIKLKETKLNQAIAGFFSGLGNGIASIDGPPVLFYLTSINAEKSRFKSTLATHFLILGVMSVIGLLLTGRYQAGFLGDFLLVAPFAIFGTILGIWLSRYFNEERFKQVVTVVLIGLAIFMII